MAARERPQPRIRNARVVGGMRQQRRSGLPQQDHATNLSLADYCGHNSVSCLGAAEFALESWASIFCNPSSREVARKAGKARASAEVSKWRCVGGEARGRFSTTIFRPDSRQIFSA